MARALGSFVAGLVAWVLIVSLINRGLRIGLPGYAAAEPTLSFTLTMMAARLTMAAATSVIAGVVVGLIARSGTAVAAVLGTLILVAFIPSHVRLWNSFPIWYHLTFLGTLVPLVVLGAWLAARKTSKLTASAAAVEVPSHKASGA
jgi:hypothetical protein